MDATLLVVQELARSAALAAVVAAFGFVLIWGLLPLASRFGLLDHPLGRKDHVQPTPTVGGIAIWSCMLLGLILLGQWSRVDIGFVLASTLLLSVGVLDDRFDLPWWLRVLAQCFAVWIVYASGVAAEHVGQLFGLETMNLGAWQLPVTMFITVGVINAINMSDGVDGLAGGLVLTTFCMFGAAAFYSGNTHLLARTGVLVGAVLGFWLWNMRFPWQRRARTFMGNAGSALLGFTIAWCALRLTQNAAHPVTPILAPWLVATPLLDCVVLIARRLLARQSPFHADRNHMHHLMLDAGFSPELLVITLMGINLALGLIASLALMAHVPQPMLVLVYLAMCAGWLALSLRRQRAVAFFAFLRHPLGGSKATTGDETLSAVRDGD